MHLGAQLPVLVRGIYYDGWRIAGKPFDERQPAEFATFVAADLPQRMDPRAAAERVSDS